MDRITEYDLLRKCYVVKPDAEQGQIIQRLGMYEDRDSIYMARIPYSEGGYYCGECHTKVDDEDIFCRKCGQRLRKDGQDEYKSRRYNQV